MDGRRGTMPVAAVTARFWIACDASSVRGAIPGSTNNAGRDLTLVPKMRSLFLVAPFPGWMAGGRRRRG